MYAGWFNELRDIHQKIMNLFARSWVNPDRASDFEYLGLDKLTRAVIKEPAWMCPKICININLIFMNVAVSQWCLFLTRISRLA